MLIKIVIHYQLSAVPLNGAEWTKTRLLLEAEEAESDVKEKYFIPSDETRNGSVLWT